MSCKRFPPYRSASSWPSSGFATRPVHLRNAVLVLATFFATPYLQDYDLVIGAFVVAWLWQQPIVSYGSERALQSAFALLLLLPLLAAPLGKLTGLAFGPLFLLPAFAMAVRASLHGRGPSFVQETAH